MEVMKNPFEGLIENLPENVILDEENVKRLIIRLPNQEIVAFSKEEEEEEERNHLGFVMDQPMLIENHCLSVSAPSVSDNADCGKSSGSMKTLFGHHRCNPESEWRAIKPCSSMLNKSCCSSTGSKDRCDSTLTTETTTGLDDDSDAATALLTLSHGNSRAAKSRPLIGDTSSSKGAKSGEKHKFLTVLTEYLIAKFEQEQKQIEADRAADEELEAYYLGIADPSKYQVSHHNQQQPSLLKSTKTSSSTRRTRTTKKLKSAITNTTKNKTDFLDQVIIPRKKRSFRTAFCGEINIQERRAQNPVLELSQNEMNKKNEHKKRKETQALSPQPVQKKMKIRNAKLKQPSPVGPEPEMPFHIREAISRLGGTMPPVWVDQKKLTHSDINPKLTRFFFPSSAAVVQFLTEDEKTEAADTKTMKVTVIDPAGDQREMFFKIWPSMPQAVFTRNTWKEFVNTFSLNHLTDTLQIWCFRLPAERGSKLCFAVNLVRTA